MVKVSIVVELEVDTQGTPYCDESDNDIVIVAEKVESTIADLIYRDTLSVKIGLYDLPINVESVDLDDLLNYTLSRK